MTNEVLQKTASDEQNVSSSNGLEAKAPLLRFRKFTHPWRQEKLSDFTSRIMRKNSNNETELPLTISSKDGLVDQVTFFNKKVSSKDMSGYYLLKNGEFAYNKSYSNGYDFGSIKRLERYEMGALSTLYICFSLKKHCSDYIKHYFDSLKWYRQIYIISAEGARNHGLLNVPTDDFFATIHFLSPDIEEQKKIADFLSLIDQRIEKQRQLVENLKKYKRGLLSAIFDNKLIGENWKKYKLSSILKERSTYSEKDGSYEHVTLSRDGIIPKTERYDRDFLVSSENKKYKITKMGDICYNPANMKFGVICLNTYGNAIFSPIYITFEIKSDFDKPFVGLYMTRNDFINRSLKFQQGTVYERMAVSPEDLLSMDIELPNLEAQKRISNIFTILDKKIVRENNIFNELQKMKRALLQQMFI